MGSQRGGECPEKSCSVARPTSQRTICWRLLIVSKARSNSRKVLATRQGALTITGSITVGPHYKAHWSRELGEYLPMFAASLLLPSGLPVIHMLLQLGADTLSRIARSILGCAARVESAGSTLGHLYRILRTQTRNASARWALRKRERRDRIPPKLQDRIQEREHC